MNVRFTVGISLIFLLAVTLIFGGTYMLMEGNVTTSTGTSNEVVTYNIEAIEDVSFGATVRKVVRVSMVSGMTKADIEWIAQDVVAQITSQQPVNAIGIFMYHTGDNYFSTARISVDWAPYGDWARANEVATGNYSSHQFYYVGLDSQYSYW